MALGVGEDLADIDPNTGALRRRVVDEDGDIDERSDSPLFIRQPPPTTEKSPALNTDRVTVGTGSGSMGKEKVNLLTHCGRDKGILFQCPGFTVSVEACRIMDVVNHVHKDAFHNAVMDYCSLMHLFLFNKKCRFNAILGSHSAKSFCCFLL